MDTSSGTVHAPPAEVEPDFRALFRAEIGYVCRALRRLGVREADLPDVAQELFVAVHARVAEIDPSRPVRPWLFSFAVRFAANYRRLARVRTDAGELPEHVASPGDVHGEARDLVLRALARLDFDRRTVVVMHDLEGFAAPEIGAALGVPLNTVYSRIRLAREDFRRAFEELQEEGAS
jgi:RNA polymerase sigma-70 factor (ECF subfamily)